MSEEVDTEADHWRPIGSVVGTLINRLIPPGRANGQHRISSQRIPDSRWSLGAKAAGPGEVERHQPGRYSLRCRR